MENKFWTEGQEVHKIINQKQNKSLGRNDLNKKQESIKISAFWTNFIVKI